MVCAVVPLKFIIPVTVTVPLFVRFPLTLICWEAFTVNVAPLLIVRFRHNAVGDACTNDGIE